MGTLHKLSLILFFITCFNVSVFSESKETLKPYLYLISGNEWSTGDFQNKLKVHGLIWLVGLYFKEDVAFRDNFKGCITKDGKVLAETVLRNEKGTTNRLFMIFNESFKFPIGKNYKAIFPASSIYSLSDSSKTFDETIVEFDVEKYFYYTRFEGGFHGDYKRLQFYFGLNVNSFDDSKMLVCREGIPILEYPIDGKDCFSDFDIGRATSRLNHDLNFEDGVRYTVILPEGSVHSIERDDIVNAEAQYDIEKSCGRSFAPIEYSSCSVEGSKGLTELGVVTVDYSTSVQLAPGARLQLLDSDGSVKKEADATLSDNGKTWTVSADFGGCVVNGGFSLCIPESTVVGTGSDITVNRRTLVPLDGSVSVESVAVSEPTVSVRGMSLMVGGVERGDRVVVCDVSGMTVCDAVADSGSMTVSLRSKGLYIVKVNGMAFKVRVS